MKLRNFFLYGTLPFAWPLLAHADASPTAPASPAANSASDASGGGSPQTIVVTAHHLDEARDSIQTSIGANDYRIDRSALDIQPGGADRGLKSVLLQAPGVAQDSASGGDLHIRNEHGNIQYRLNGITVPDTTAGFGPLVDTRVAESVELITGALPAQYGYRTAGIVALKTRENAFDLGGDVSLYGGGNNTLNPSASFHDSFGRLNVYASASYLRSDLGLENPTPDTKAIHDTTEQYRGFGYLSYLIDDKSRVELFGGTSFGKFQIPNTPGVDPTFTLNGQSTFDSSLLDQNQRRRVHFGVLSYQYSGDHFDVQVAPFIRWQKLSYTPDPNGGELLFNGADSALTQTDLAAGIQTDASYHAGDAHTIRFGLFFQNESNTTDSLNRVFTIDDQGNQTSDAPLSIPVNVHSVARTFGAYLQDEWKLSPTLTFNYGLRYDRFAWQLTEDQLSPRAGIVWKPRPGTTFHAGYARYFTPPPLSQIGVGALEAFNGTTGASEVLTADPVRAEREHSFDIGAQQIVARHLTLGIDAYYKIKRNLLDDTYYGATNLLAPFNYAKSYSWGVELSTSWEHGPFQVYGNLARGEQKGKRITSNQFFFSQADLDYISNHYIFTDHSQKWTASGGASAKIRDPWGEFRPSFDFIYGSGLRTDDPNGIIPNGGTERPYVQFNLGLAQVIGGDKRGVTLRVDVVNLFDKTYLIHDGSGIGGGAAQYGPRRTVMFGVSKSF